MASDFKRQVLRIRLKIEEEQYDEALANLEALHPADEDEQKELQYLRAWYLIQMRRWDEAIQFLPNLCPPEEVDKEWDDNDHSERERRAYYLLWLGYAASNLSLYNDAARHFTHSLKILNMRRVHLPRLRIKALYGLGMTCIMNGLFTVAIQHDTEALRVCRKENLLEDLPDIYYGLCDAYRQAGKFEDAYSFGQQALELYKERVNREMECRIQNLLGRVAFLQGEHQKATDHYMESISLAVLLNKPSMQFLNFVALAELRRDEERLEEARNFCARAEEVAKQMREDPHLFGMMYIACGKISLAEAEQAKGEERTRLLREALESFMQAERELKQTQAGMHRSELYGHLAQINEALGNAKEALAYWKLACNVVPQREI